MTVASSRLEMLVEWMKMDIMSFWDVRTFRIYVHCIVLYILLNTFYLRLCLRQTFYLRSIYARCVLLVPCNMPCVIYINKPIYQYTHTHTHTHTHINLVLLVSEHIYLALLTCQKYAHAIFAPVGLTQSS